MAKKASKTVAATPVVGVPRKVVAELHAALKDAEASLPHSPAAASQAFQNITARALVTLLAAMCTPEAT